MHPSSPLFCRPERCWEPKFNGLIQHSFALRMVKDRMPFYGETTDETVAERFSLPGRGGAAGFRVTPVGAFATTNREPAPHSLLAERDRTTVAPQRIAFLERDENGNHRAFPEAFSWADKARKSAAGEIYETRIILAEKEGDRPLSHNDFLVAATSGEWHEDAAMPTSRVLLQFIAHRRSLLFGVALANRFVNVMLPHALLEPAPDTQARCRCGCRSVRDAKGYCERKAEWTPGCWILQPMVSLIRVADDAEGPFRRMYTVTLFLIPVEGSAYGERKMSECELHRMIDAGWSLVSSPQPQELPRFSVRGPLPGYLSRLARPDVSGLLHGSAEPLQRNAETDRETWSPSTLRRTTETIAFAVALRMAQGPVGHAAMQTKRHIGNGIVTSLGSARMSSVVVVDNDLTRNDIRNPRANTCVPPGRLGRLMETLAGEIRVPRAWTPAQRRKFMLDQAFYDRDSYAVGVLPTLPCLVITSARDAQRGRHKSGLTQAGNAAYMTIGAAAAIGTLRAIDRDLEGLEDSDPTKISRIESEIAVDLHEIYDLDITHEGYRHLYRRLRDRLGITRDYKALQGEMEALYRENTTRYEAKMQVRLVSLTAAIVFLSLLILFGTLAK